MPEHALDIFIENATEIVWVIPLNAWERSGSVVEYLTQDQGVGVRASPAGMPLGLELAIDPPPPGGILYTMIF